MTTAETKIQEFKQKQVSILEMQLKTKEEVDKVIAEFKQKSEALQKEYQDKVNTLEQPTKNELEKYKAELKAWLGITDGENINVLQTAEAFLRLVKESQA